MYINGTNHSLFIPAARFFWACHDRLLEPGVFEPRCMVDASTNIAIVVVACRPQLIMRMRRKHATLCVDRKVLM